MGGMPASDVVALGEEVGLEERLTRRVCMLQRSILTTIWSQSGSSW